VTEPTTRPGGITMLDAAALVTGAAVASVHFREFTGEIAALTPVGWLFLVSAFAWLGLTAAGPFVFLVRRFSRRPEGYPGPGDGLWLAFGLPWVAAALLRSGAGSLIDGGNAAYVNALFLGLFAASALGLRRLLARFPGTEPGPWHVPGTPPRHESWTQLIGRAVTVAWPLQLGLGFVVTK